MATATAEAPKAGEQFEVVEEGGRWLHGKPSGDQVSDWFKKQPLHEGMSHDGYLSGIVLIPQTDKFKVTKAKANGEPYEVELEQAAYVPYVKVETRVSYFWDYVRSHGDWVGVIEPVKVPQVTDPNSAFYNAHLPEGFGVHAARVLRGNNDTVTRYILATYRVAIYERQSYAEAHAPSPDGHGWTRTEQGGWTRAGQPTGKAPIPVLAGIGTKQVPVNQRNGYADDSAVMKAQTGAIGRALGVAGILVVGTGVATAEDVQEAQGGGGGSTSDAPLSTPPIVDREGQQLSGDGLAGGPAPQEAAAAPESAEERPAALSDEELRAHAVKLQGEMQQAFPEAWKAYVAWYTEDRQFGPLDSLTGPALKGAVTKLERDLDTAKREGSG